MRGEGTGSGLTLVFLALALGIASIEIATTHPSSAASLTPRSPILITGDPDFTAANGVTAGDGTAANPYVIDGWDITIPCDTGIRVVDATAHFVVRNITINTYGYECSIGVAMLNVSNGVVENVTLSDFFVRGVYVLSSNNLVISANDLSGGMWIDSSNVIAVTANRIRGTQGGIVFNASHQVTAEDNVLDGTNGGIGVVHSSEVGVRNNTVARTQGGLSVSLSTRVEVSGNTIVSNNAVGIYPTNTDNLTISDNTLIGNAANEIQLEFDQDVVISGNNAKGAVGAIDARNVARLVISNNTLSNNGWGVYLRPATDVTIRDNEISANYAYALAFESSSNIIVEGNNLSHGSLGVVIGGPWSGLTVIHNNIYGWVGDPYATDVYDSGYPSGGNYWSAYQDPDKCSGATQGLCGQSDGFGDRPFSLGGAEDHFPLMEPLRLSFNLVVFGSPGWCIAPCSVRFGAQLRGGVPPLAYAWRLGDGGTSALARPEHVYDFAGTYDASVAVQDATGRTAEGKFSVTVEGTASGGSGILPASALYSGSGIVIAAVVITMFIYVTRIKRRRPPASNGPSPPPLR